MTHILPSSARWPHLPTACCVCLSLDAKRTWAGTYYCKPCAEECKAFLARHAAEEKP